MTSKIFTSKIGKLRQSFFKRVGMAKVIVD